MTEPNWKEIEKYIESVTDIQQLDRIGETLRDLGVTALGRLEQLEIWADEAEGAPYCDDDVLL